MSATQHTSPSGHEGADASQVSGRSFDAVVIGGGVIGLASAWQASRRGLAVAVVDPYPGHGASWAAAGMLAPVTEAHYGEEALLHLSLASARLWGAFAEELEADTGSDIGYRRCGTMLVAFDDDDRMAARQLYEFQLKLGLQVRWVSGREAREMEPNLAPGIRGALWAPNDHQVRTRHLVRALLDACQESEVAFVPERAVALEAPGGRLSAVRLASGIRLTCGAAVLAAGSWSRSVDGLPELAQVPLRPVKGVILRLAPAPLTASATPETEPPPLLTRTVRGMVQGSHVYLVPRADGSIVLGATSEERGFDTTVSVGALHDLIRLARRLVPGVTEMVLADATAGLRPATADNGPVIAAMGGDSGAEGLVLAFGHYRNGILLTPITASAVSAWLCGDPAPDEVSAFGPSRFCAPGSPGLPADGVR